MVLVANAFFSEQVVVEKERVKKQDDEEAVIKSGATR
jgi:hypothetical protein